MGAQRATEPAPSQMHSSVNWALLGLVIERPSYAYELAHRFERTYEGALSLSSVSHVYTALAALKGRFLIEEISGTRTGRQPKPRYRVTALGFAEYRAWLLGQLAEESRRQRLFVQQMAALMRSPQAAETILDDYERECLAAMVAGPASAGVDEAAFGTAHLAGRLVAEERRLALAAKLAWVQYAQRELQTVVRSAPAPQCALAQ
jgi:DNA-binding PadR family transcriptional regulator